ncbi:hypothetical protein, partial [Bacillus phage SPG24]
RHAKQDLKVHFAPFFFVDKLWYSTVDCNYLIKYRGRASLGLPPG